MGVLSGISLWELIKHALSWVTNLKRAKEARKQASKQALRKVIIAARKTAVYSRRLERTGKPSPKKEEDLSVLWTELSFALEDLGLDKLARRCRIKGKHWAAPAKIGSKYFRKADDGLERMEDLAEQILKELK